MPIAAATGAAGSTTALVGTAEQVCESLLAYYAAGCSTVLIRGFDPLQDTVDYGKELIPMLRAEAAARSVAELSSARNGYSQVIGMIMVNQVRHSRFRGNL